MSLLTITSRHYQQANASTVIFHHAKTISRLSPSPPQQSLDHEGHGTKVTVNDLFGNMPVRVKSRALALQRPDDMDREWEELKRMLTALVLANDRPLKLILSEVDKNRKVVIRAKSPSVESQFGVDLGRIGSILSQAGLIPLKSTESWVTVSASTPDLSIHSCISLLPSPTKQVQFISMGINPIFAHSSANVLYNEVNRIFAASDFGASSSYQETEERRKTTVLQTGTNVKGTSKGINRWPMFYIRIEMGELWRVSIEETERFESNRSLQRILDVLGAMVYQFLEQHHFRPRARKWLRQSPKQLSEPNGRHGRASKKERDVPKCISGFAQPPTPQRPMSSTEETLDSRIKLPSFHKRRSTLTIQDFGGWSRIKSGNGNVFDEICSGLNRRPELAQGSSLSHCSSQADPDTRCLVERGLRERSCDPEKVDNGESEQVTTTQSTGSDSGDGIISWIDPVTKCAVLVNSRTGQCLPPKPLSSTAANPSPLCARPRSTGSLGDHRNLNVIKRPQSAPSQKSSLWLEDIMDKWDNPAFPRLEKPIPSIHSDVNGDGRPEGKLDFRVRPDLCGLPTCGDTKSSRKLWKRGLAEANVIGQVDRKFILVRMTAAPLDSSDRSSGSLLVLVDQHAADERCRIEQLFDETFTSQAGPENSGEVMNVRTFEFSSPISFEIAAHETRLFRAYSEFFASWGCHYEVSDLPEEGNATVSVSALPTLIAERCRAEPKLVLDLLRGEIWNREENKRGFSVRPALATSKKLSEGVDETLLSEPIVGLPSWVGQVADCPEGIIDLLNSRACRTAVMFNDILSVEEYENLISRLSRCVFPFQCAHGRPSMIPILDLTSQMRDDDFNMLDIGYEHTKKDLGTELGFAEAFRAWKDTRSN